MRGGGERRLLMREERQKGAGASERGGRGLASAVRLPVALMMAPRFPEGRMDRLMGDGWDAHTQC